jgi:hypothetical protein
MENITGNYTVISTAEAGEKTVGTVLSDTLILIPQIKAPDGLLPRIGISLDGGEVFYVKPFTLIRYPFNKAKLIWDKFTDGLDKVVVLWGINLRFDQSILDGGLVKTQSQTLNLLTDYAEISTTLPPLSLLYVKSIVASTTQNTGKVVVNVLANSVNIFNVTTQTSVYEGKNLGLFYLNKSNTPVTVSIRGSSLSVPVNMVLNVDYATT